MMKLSTMLKVDSTVDIQWRSRIAERILEYWEYDQGSARFFRSSTNFVYIFRKGGERYFLRFAESAERTRMAIEQEIALLRWVAGSGMIVTTPILSKNGQSIESVETDLGTFHAVVFAGLQGAQVDIEKLSSAQFETWGATLGKLHAILHLYPGLKLSARSTWSDHLNVAQSYIPKDELTIQTEFDHITSILSTFPVTETNYGLVHFDFELDNLFWQDDTIAMLDFDDCSYYWYVADIAFALRDLFEDHIDLNNPSFRAFIDGYSKHYPLDEDLLSHLPTFIRMANLMQYLRLVRTMDLVVGQDYPQVYTSLIVKLKNKMDRYKTSLLPEDPYQNGSV